MKNVTISMDEADLAWVRAQAGAAGVSVSRWIADEVAMRRRRDADLVATNERIDEIYSEILEAQDAERRAGVVHPPRKQTYREMLDEELDERFRRFDHADLSDGYERTGQGGDLRGGAESGANFKKLGPQSSSPE